MHQQLFIADIASVEHADALIAQYGEEALYEAAARAEQSRDLGNVINFCRWRQIERLIAMLAHEVPLGTIH